jgi:hypothetical protein
MKKTRKKPAKRDSRPHYDFSQGVRGKYADRLGKEAKRVVLDPDVAEEFDSSEAVNAALRTLAAIPRPKRRRNAS